MNDAPLHDAALALERWDTYAAIGAARSAREATGDPAVGALGELLEARARLLVAERPDALAVPAVAPDLVTAAAPALRASQARLDIERLLASGLSPAGRVQPPDLGEVMTEDAVAANVLHALGVVGNEPAGIAGVERLDTENDPLGWRLLARAVDADAEGRPPGRWIKAAVATAEAAGARSVLAAALQLRVVIGTRRKAYREERKAQVELVELLESWAMELSTDDARTAMARPDRQQAVSAELAPVTGSARLVKLALAMSAERRLERLVALALDAALAETSAERGALLLNGGEGEFHIADSRSLDGTTMDDSRVSSTVARRALERGEIVAANDVTLDAALARLESVELGITSLLCVPIKTRGTVEGAIYLDRRSRGRPFDDSAIAAAAAIGALLASSLLASRTLGELEARTAELEDARHRLMLALDQQREEYDRVKAELEAVRPNRKLPTLIGSSSPMRSLRRLIEQVAGSDAPVLIAGETGTGKDLVAQWVHQLSPRADGPFVAVNCGAVSEGVLEAELFGAERGAFTSANQQRQGLLEAADGGTLFLDEVGDMPASMQVAMLRFLETSELRRVGSTRTRKVDVRIVAASHKDLADQVAAGAFRADLRYRLEVVKLQVPALRERRDDIEELAEYLLLEASRRYNLPPKRLSPAALTRLKERDWLGNVRELRHALVQAALSSPDDDIAVGTLPPPPPSGAVPAARSQPSGALNLPQMPRTERVAHILRALEQTDGNRTRAARLLGISRATFYRYLEEHQLDPANLPTAAGRDGS